MENTSKALLIIGAILIVIILISVGVLIAGSANDTAKQAQDVGNIISVATKNSLNKLGNENLNHTGTIPGGGVYVSKDGVTYTAGQTMPSAQIGDTYRYGDYEYELNHYKGWSVNLTNRTKVAYGNVLETINNRTIYNMIGTYRECKNLLKAPKIPKTVINMNNTFGGCESLNKAPDIPDGVIHMNNTFNGCINLITGPEIPNSVKYMSDTFENCESLITVHNISAKVEILCDTFKNCKSLIKAPEIPETVRQSYGTFENCESLEGILIYNSNKIDITTANGYGDFLKGTKLDIIIKGNCDSNIKEKLAATADNGNVTWE